MWRIFVFGLAALALSGEDLPRGRLIDQVQCIQDASQSYALYLPSNYSPNRRWNLLMAFDPRARGRMPVERYQAAAEQYGYIVAGSLNSRNGPTQVSWKAASAMLDDLEKRFSIDPNRVYTAGQSGGARFAMDFAITTNKVAGVIASSAGFPDEPRVSLPFPVFATAGTEDFNHLEMRQFDHLLSSPHRLRIFEGGHTWLPSDLAVEAIEWMEIQAMKSGRRPRDEALIRTILEKRKEQAAALNGEAEYLAVSALASDFKGLADVSSFAARAAALGRDPKIQQALAEDRAADQREQEMMQQLDQYEYELENPAARAESLGHLKVLFADLGRQANAAADSAERQMARRVISATNADGRGRSDPELQKLINSAQPGR